MITYFFFQGEFYKKNKFLRYRILIVRFIAKIAPNYSYFLTGHNFFLMYLRKKVPQFLEAWQNSYGPELWTQIILDNKEKELNAIVSIRGPRFN